MCFTLVAFNITLLRTRGFLPNVYLTAFMMMRGSVLFYCLLQLTTVALNKSYDFLLYLISVVDIGLVNGRGDATEYDDKPFCRLLTTADFILT